MKRKMTALFAAVIAAAALSGCSGSGKGSDAEYLKDIKLSKYVTLGDYKGISVEVASPDVSDSEVESYLQYVSSTMPATNEITDRPVQNGDTVNIDYAGRYADSGEAFDGGTAQGYDLVIGSGSFIGGFEDGLIGAETGETRDLNLTFPEDYGNTDLAGVDVIFTVTVNKILEKPELDDEYAASLGIEGVSNLDELRSYIRDRLIEEAQSSYDSEVESKVLEEVTNGCMFENPPQAMLDRFGRIYDDEAGSLSDYYAANYGTTFSTDEIFNMLMAQEGYSGELDDYKLEKALELAKKYIMLGLIAENEELEVTDEELDAKLSEDMATANSTSGDSVAYENLDAYKESIDPEGVRENMLIDKATDFLINNANVTEPSSDSADTETEGGEETAD